MAVVASLRSANARVEAGEFASQNQQIRVEAGSFFTRKEDVEQVVVGVSHGRPVLLRDVAERIEDGPAEPDQLMLTSALAAEHCAAMRMHRSARSFRQSPSR